MDKLFEIEQEIFNCWNIVEDLDIIAESLENNIMLLGLKDLYELKFQKLQSVYEEVINEVYSEKSIPVPE